MYKRQVYGCAFLLVGRLVITVVLVVFSWVATMVSFGLQVERVDEVDLATCLLYTSRSPPN